MKSFFLINWSSHVFHGPRKKIRSIWSRQISKKIPPTFILLFPPQNISCASRRKPASYAPVPLRSTAILLQFYNWSRFFPRINGSRFCSCIIEFQLEQLDSVFARGNVVDNDRGCDPGNAIRLISNLDHLEFDPLKLRSYVLSEDISIGKLSISLYGVKSDELADSIREEGEILSRDHSRNTYVIVIIIGRYFDEVLN